jgi:periplasmic protein TonB
MPEWKLLLKVDPEYPADALQHHIEGVVRFTVIIGKDGRIEHMRLFSGHPLLVRAARQAGQQWVYRPTMIGGEAVRVITQVEIQFRLDPYGKPVRHEDQSVRSEPPPPQRD